MSNSNIPIQKPSKIPSSKQDPYFSCADFTLVFFLLEKALISHQHVSISTPIPTKGQKTKTLQRSQAQKRSDGILPSAMFVRVSRRRRFAPTAFAFDTYFRPKHIMVLVLPRRWGVQHDRGSRVRRRRLQLWLRVRLGECILDQVGPSAAHFPLQIQLIIVVGIFDNII